METTKITINEKKLLTAIESAVRTMNGFSWGWGIAIEIESDGSISSTDIISNNTYSGGDEIELLRIETWEDEFQNNVRAWYNDNLDENLKTELDAFFENHNIDEGTYSIETLIELGLPQNLKEDYENYQVIVIDDAVDRIMEHYKYNEIPAKIDLVVYNTHLEIELIEG